MVCLDLLGNLRWYRGLGHDYPKAANDVGMASSPVVVADTVVAQVENQGDSFVAGIDRNTGENLWRLPRDPVANWSSPAVLPGENGVSDLILLKSPKDVSAHDPLTGETVWRYETPRADGIASVVAVDGLVYLPGGAMTVLRPGPDGSAPELVWESNRVRPDTSSPVVTGDHVYALAGGILSCALVSDGTVVWQKRLEGSYWATPVLIDDYLICANQDGQLKIVSLSKKGEVTAQMELEEPLLASPAVSDDGVFIRSDRHLWKYAL
jgi:outer membrane protein assembly factor BamB